MKKVLMFFAIPLMCILAVVGLLWAFSMVIGYAVTDREERRATTVFEKEKEKVLLNIYNKIIECEQDSGEECYMIFLPESEAQIDGRKV